MAKSFEFFFDYVSPTAYLAHFGWTKGQPWGVEVQMPKGFDPVRARRTLMQSPATWAEEGIRDMRGRAVPDHGRASILLPGGASGPAFMIFDNFEIFLKLILKILPQ